MYSTKWDPSSVLSSLLACFLKYKIFDSFIRSKVQIWVFIVPGTAVTPEDSHSLKFLGILRKTSQDPSYKTVGNILQDPLSYVYSSEAEFTFPVSIHIKLHV